MHEMLLRCFIAIGITDLIKKNIGELLDILKKYDVDVKWVVPENIHLTLKFLGKTPDDLLPKIVESLSSLASSYEAFYIKICNTGVFPNKRYPRVIWVGVEDSDIIENLKKDIERSMSLLGFQKEDKAFKPHLTVGRVRSQKGIISIVNELDNFSDREFGIVHADRIKLMKSDLKPMGAQYTCLNDVQFGKYKVS